SRLQAVLAEIDAELDEGSDDVPLAEPIFESAAQARPIDSAPVLLDVLRQFQLLSVEQWQEVAAIPAIDPQAPARELVERGWLTPHQVNQLFLGRAAELVLASYVVLERLGQGGTGQVFKARHQGLRRVVALKVIRRELLTDPEVVSRFYREVRLVAQLDHP